MGAFSMYVCGLGDVVALFLEERKADTLLRLRGARSRFQRHYHLQLSRSSVDSEYNSSEIDKIRYCQPSR